MNKKMNANYKKTLTADIVSLSAWIDSQTERYNRACECLSVTKASLATSKMVKKHNNEAFTADEQHHHNALIEEAYNNVSSSLEAILELKKILKNIEDELLLLD